MKYIVMECYPSYAVLLDENGSFYKAANLHYEIGQIIENPVLMKQTSLKQHRTIKWISSGIVAIAACFIMVFGFIYYQNYMATYSSIFLSINPSIQMDLNKHGTVVGLTGTNEDGVALVEGYDCKGKDKVTVTDELIKRAIDMGFLSEGGRVSFSIDTPDEVLFQEYGVELRSNVAQYLDGKMTVTIEIFNYKDSQQNLTDDNSSSSSALPSSCSSISSSTSPSSSQSAQPSQPAHTPPRSDDYDDTDYGPNNDGVTDYDDGNTNYDDDEDDDDEDMDDDGENSDDDDD